MRRFPLGLTLVAGVAFAILIGLGVWQLHRLAWKQELLAKIAALKVAPGSPDRGGAEAWRRGAWTSNIFGWTPTVGLASAVRAMPIATPFATRRWAGG